MCTHDEAMLEERSVKVQEAVARLAEIDVKNASEFRKKAMKGAALLWCMGFVVTCVGMYLLG